MADINPFTEQTPLGELLRTAQDARGAANQDSAVPLRLSEVRLELQKLWRLALHAVSGRITSGKSPERLVNAVVNSHLKLLQWRIVRPIVHFSQADELDRLSAAASKAASRLTLYTGPLRAEEGQGKNGPEEPRADGRPPTRHNKKRDEWIAKLREKDPPMKWEEIFDELARIGPGKKWNVPRNHKSLTEAYYRHLKRGRRKVK